MTYVAAPPASGGPNSCFARLPRLDALAVALAVVNLQGVLQCRYPQCSPTGAGFPEQISSAWPISISNRTTAASSSIFAKTGSASTRLLLLKPTPMPVSGFLQKVLASQQKASSFGWTPAARQEGCDSITFPRTLAGRSPSGWTNPQSHWRVQKKLSCRCLHPEAPCSS